MNTYTGEIKYFTDEEVKQLDKSKWKVLDFTGTEKQIDKEKARIALLRERIEGGSKYYRYKPKQRSKYTPHTGGGQYKETK